MSADRAPYDLVVHSADKIDATGRTSDFWLAVGGDRIAATGRGDRWRRLPATASVDAAGRHLTPGFLDLHGHGAGGHAYEDDAEGIEKALAVHRAHGTTRSVLSLVANPPGDLARSLTTIATLAATDPLILGSHLEGPYLSPRKAGAHNPAYLHTPDPREASRLLDAAGGTLRQVTIAPELPGALEVIRLLSGDGIVVALGHTAAGYDEAQAGFDAGARLLTHTFNAMNGIHHRAPGPIIAAFGRTDVSLELVLDGVHVLPPVARLPFTEAAGRVALITDAMAATGAPDGDYLLGSLEVSVTDGKAVLRGTDSIAGSTLTQDRALGIAIRSVGISAVDAVAALTLTPARVLGRDDELGLLSPGYAADLVLLDEAWGVDSVWAAGQKIA